MKKISIILVFIIGFIQYAGASATKEEADKAYQENNFKDAIEKYEQILETEGESADIYYNLGNSYYKDKNMAKAVLNYERALLLDPGNSDARFNLELACGKTVDQIVPMREIFIVSWIKSIANCMSERGWGIMGIVSFLVLLGSLMLYIFGKRLVLKKIGFIAAVLCLIVTVSSNLFANSQKDRLQIRSGAIIMAPSITIKSTPDETGTDLFVLHEGTKVYIEDNTMKEWKEIRLEDGKKGWIQTKNIEVI